MRPPFRLVEGIVSTDTVEVLRQLLGRAKKGELIGVAVVAMGKARSYEFELTGEAARSGTFALGAVGKLWHRIAERIDGE